MSVCPECGEHLIESLPESEDEIVEEPEEGMLCLHRSADQHQSDSLTDALKEAGIQFVFKPLRRYLSTGAYDGEFYVSEDDFEDARDVAETILGEIEGEVD
jgi:hypothetical protein